MYNSKEKNTVLVELYNLKLSEETDDRFGRVIPSRSLNENDLINIAVNQRTDLHAETLRASLDLLMAIAIHEIANGNRVEFGLGHFSLTVKGVFIGDHAPWNPAINKLCVKIGPSMKLRKAIDDAYVDIRGMANSGAIINSLTDLVSGERNTCLTPGGGATLFGRKIRIAGKNPSNGIRLINQGTKEVYLIPKASLVLNDPKKVSFIVPPLLPPGDYKIELTTQFTTSYTKLLKEPRTYLLNEILEV
jgi:hypothetical protein